MPYIIAIEYSESQPRQIAETLSQLAKLGRPLSAKYEAEIFPSWADLFSTIIQPGLFAQQESFVVYSAESLGTFPENLAHLIENPKPKSAKSSKSAKTSEPVFPSELPDCVLILVFSTTDIKTLKSIAQSISIITHPAEVPPWKRKDWLLDLAKSQSIKISYDAAVMLADSITSQEELRSELLKLSSFAGKREISTADVEAVSFDEGGSALMKFIDGICDNKPRDVVWAVKFLKQDSILPVLAAITNRLRPAMLEAHFPENLHTDALNAIDHDPIKKKYAVGKARNALKNYGAECIKLFMLKAARLSFLEKTGRAEGWEGFELIIWELMAKTKRDSHGGIF